MVEWKEKRQDAMNMQSNGILSCTRRNAHGMYLCMNAWKVVLLDRIKQAHFEAWAVCSDWVGRGKISFPRTYAVGTRTSRTRMHTDETSSYIHTWTARWWWCMLVKDHVRDEHMQIKRFHLNWNWALWRDRLINFHWVKRGVNGH